MPGRVVLFGATGYTGGLVAERLVARGEWPLLAGRSAPRLVEVAGRLGGLEWAEADAGRPETVAALVGSGDVLVTTVGPFATRGEAAVGAAIAAPAVYLDSTGEPSFIRRVFEDLGPAAAGAGAGLMTAMGYDYVPGALAGALAVEDAGREVERVDVGYFALRAGAGMVSRGTAASLAGVALEPMFAFRDGRLRTVRAAERARTFRVAGRERAAVSVGGAEHFTLPAAFPQLREVNVHLGSAGALAPAVQAAGLAAAVAGRVPGVRAAVRVGGELLAAQMPGPAPGTTSGATSWVAAAAYDGAGRTLAEVHLRGADPYAFTAAFLAWAAQRARRDGIGAAGAVGPVEAFGLAALERGCAEAGLERV
jgi:short subunit dehydrogenase-like uncharacterized protein